MTSLSWIPSEAIEGAQRYAFDSGITHYDPPPPSEDLDLEALRDADRFRFANELRAWIEVDATGHVTDCGYAGGGLIGSTTVSVAGLRHKFEAVQLPDLQREPELGDGWVRFVQTTGGRTGLPAPRRVRRRPFIQWQAPLVWTTLSLTLHIDGRVERALIGRQPLPAPLGLRRKRDALAQVGAHRLQGLVPPVVRAAHPLGRPGLRSARDGGRDRARALALGPGHGREWQGEGQTLPGRSHPGQAG